MSFTARETFEIDDPLRNRIADLLRETTKTLTPFTGHLSMPGYGIRSSLHSEPEGARFAMAPFCWCGGTDCPWCAPDLTPEEGYSAHEILRLRPVFEKAGFIPFEGAPNFIFQDDTTEIRVWWYKYIGRGMRTAPHLSADMVEHLATRIPAILAENARLIWSRDISSALALAADVVPPDVSETYRASFLSLLDVPDPDARRARLAQVTDALRHLLHISGAAQDLARITALLDARGVSRYDDPDAPEEFRMEYAPSHRTACALDGRDPRDEDDIGF